MLTMLCAMRIETNSLILLDVPVHMLILYAILIFSNNNDKAATVSPDSLILFLLHPTFHLPAGYILLFYNALLSLLLETSSATR